MDHVTSRSAPHRPTLSLDGVPATPVDIQCRAITEPLHICVPCLESSLNTVTHLTPPTLMTGPPASGVG